MGSQVMSQRSAASQAMSLRSAASQGPPSPESPTSVGSQAASQISGAGTQRSISHASNVSSRRSASQQASESQVMSQRSAASRVSAPPESLASVGSQAASQISGAGTQRSISHASNASKTTAKSATSGLTDLQSSSDSRKSAISGAGVGTIDCGSRRSSSRSGS